MKSYMVEQRKGCAKRKENYEVEKEWMEKFCGEIIQI